MLLVSYLWISSSSRCAGSSDKQARPGEASPIENIRGKGFADWEYTCSFVFLISSWDLGSKEGRPSVWACASALGLTFQPHPLVSYLRKGLIWRSFSIWSYTETLCWTGLLKSRLTSFPCQPNSFLTCFLAPVRPIDTFSLLQGGGKLLILLIQGFGRVGF